MATIPEAFTVAQHHHRAGRIAEAERGYREILAIDPGHVGSLHFLGVLAHQAGRNDAAVHLISRALALDPGSPDAHVNLANVLKDQGNLQPAISHYQRALALKPENGEVHYCLGVALHLHGELDRALGHYERAIALRPDIAEAQLNMGSIRADQGELEAAVMSYRQALRLRPDYLAAHINLGIALSRGGELIDAAQSFERAVAIAPDHAEAHTNLGMALARQGKPEAGLANCQRAVALAPDDADAHLNLGTVLADLARYSEAVPHFERALSLRPGSATAHLNLGAASRELNALDAAVAHYERALELDPGLAEAHYGLGVVFQQLGQSDEARIQQQRALTLKPDYGPARFARCMADLPILYREESEIARRRAAYREQLQRFCNEVGHASAIGGLAAAVGSNQPFFLAYQQQNDRELQALYGAMVCRLMAEKYPAPGRLPRRSGNRLRVGFVCGYFCWHTVWKLFLKGWLSRLDRGRFQVFGYHTGTVRDATTELAAGLCDGFVRGPLSAERWRETILADRPDVLIYPEVGMDGMAGWLAAQRLAPTQCVAWGHPDTSGFPTLDYFLTSDAMEPSDGQEHYTEQLIRLPNLSIYYEPLNLEPITIERPELGLRPTATVFWCPQSLYKYLPQYDCVFPRVAREVGDCQFVFIRYPYGDHITNLFWERLERAFAEFGLAAREYCVVLPVLEQQGFIAAAGLCDIVLDSIGWSGGVTTLESLIHDLPIVTMPGSLMRGRHTMAMLELMGVAYTIAATISDYVSLAVRLARDRVWRTEVKRRIAVGKHRLYRDRSSIAALEDFLLGATGAETRDARAKLLGS
jgi:predicted O-linked N-acetylglucosamine transferase (SPINDLY family)